MRGRECCEIDSSRGIRKGLSPALGRWTVFTRQRREGKAFQEQGKKKVETGLACLENCQVVLEG